MQRYVRICQMVETINQGRAPTVDYFCRLFEVRPRTVHQDIRTIKEELGYQIEFDRFRNGYVNRHPDKKLPTFDLSEGEFFALALGRDMLAEYSGTVFEPFLRSAIDKITARLPNNIHVNFGDIQSLVKFRPGGVPSFDRKTFFDLNKACEQQSPVEIEYYSPASGDVTTRKVDPYRLLERSGVWYVLAWCHLRKAMRTFALHRIRHYTLFEDERFRVKEDLDVDKFVASAFILEHGDGDCPVKIKFNPQSARYIKERNWHSSQKITDHEDGSCTLELVAQSLDEIKRWILYYGSSAVVLEPAVLREAVKNDLKDACKNYDN